MVKFPSQKMISTILRRGAVIATAGLVIVIGTLGYLNTTSGKNQLVSWLNSQLSSPNSTVVISALEGSLFSNFTVPRITVADDKGVWIEVESTTITWSPLGLLRRQLNIDSLDIHNIQLNRLPNTSAATSSSAQTFPLPVGINVRGLTINALHFKDDPRLFHSKGNVQLARAGHGAIDLNLGTGDNNDDELAIAIQFPKGMDALSAKVVLKAHHDGPFAALLNVPLRDDLHASLQGDGPVENWDGAFKARIGQSNIIDAHIQRVDEALTIKAMLDAGAFERDLGGDFFGGPASLVLLIAPEGKARDFTAHLTLDAKKMTLKADGPLSAQPSKGAQNFNFSFDLLEPDTINMMASPLTFAPFKANGTFTHAQNEEQIVAHFKALDLGVSSDVAGRFSGQLEASSRAQDVAFTVKGVINNLRGKAIAGLPKAVKNGLKLSLDGQYAKQLLEAGLSISNPALDIHTQLSFAKDVGALKGTLKTRIADISLFNTKLKGGGVITSLVQKKQASDPLIASLSIDATHLDLGNALLNDVIGSSPRIRVNALQKADGMIDVKTITLHGALVNFDATALISPQNIIQKADYHLAFTDLENIKSLEGMALSGHVDAVGTLSGPLASPSLTLETGLQQIDVQNLKLRHVTARINADQIFTRASGHIAMESETNLGDLSGRMTVSTDAHDTLNLSAIKIELGRYHASGAIKLPVNTPATGAINLETMSKKSAPSPLSGVITADIQLKDLAGAQSLAMNGHIDDLVLPLDDNNLLTLKSGQLTAKALWNKTNTDISLNAQMQDLSHPRIQANDLSLKIDGRDDNFAYNMRVQGTKHMPFDLGISGRAIQQQKAARQISINVDGHVNGAKMHTPQPLALVINPEGYMLSPATLNIGDGVITGQFAAITNKMQASFTAENADLRPFVIFAPEAPFFGTLNGALAFKATPLDVAGNFSFALSSLTYGPKLESVHPDLIIDTKGRFTQKNVSLTAGAHIKDVLDTEMTATLPLAMDLENTRIAIDETKPLKADLSWSGDIGPIWPILDFPTHDLSGKADVHLALGGTLSQPVINGKIGLNEGHYENMRTGFVASDIAMASTIADSLFTLDKFEANDGGTGRVSANAKVEINPDLSYQAQGELHLSHARLVRQPHISLTASSDIKFLKEKDTSKIYGDITVEKADIGAVTQGGPTIVSLDVREINAEGEEIISTDNAGAHIGPFDIDLHFKAPGKLFIRSYGIDSEWSADLKMFGTTDAPYIAGAATLVRGVFEFSGKRFDLTHGTITVPDDKKNDPILDIVAEHKLSDFMATLHITGRASSPRIEISSAPSLPQDEILARIIFGTTTAELSPLEAIQLASALHSLSKGGEAGMTGNMRRALGINRLSIDSDKDHGYGTTITGGKYITDNVYVEVTSAPSTGEAATAIEVRISKNLSLVTRRTLDHDNNIAIRWFWKY